MVAPVAERHVLVLVDVFAATPAVESASQLRAPFYNNDWSHTLATSSSTVEASSSLGSPRVEPS
jgi:hypothetical protein